MGKQLEATAICPVLPEVCKQQEEAPTLWTQLVDMFAEWQEWRRFAQDAAAGDAQARATSHQTTVGLKCARAFLCVRPF